MLQYAPIISIFMFWNCFFFKCCPRSEPQIRIQSAPQKTGRRRYLCFRILEIQLLFIYVNLISLIFVILHLCFSNLKRYGCLTGASTLKSWASKKSSPSQIAKLRVSWHRRRIHWVRFTYGQRPCKRYAIYLYYAYWGLPK